jgi:RimJ/RimL family protein N-acetyltransferase
MSPDADPLPRRGIDVVLRRLAVSDLPVFQAYRQDPLVSRYQDWYDKSDAEARAFLAEMNSAKLLQPGVWSQIGIADPDSLGLIGDIGLLLASDGRDAQIGFALRRKSQGQGRGAAAVRAAIDLVFEQTSADRVLGFADIRNLPSIRLLQRVGMRMIASRDVIFRDEPCVEHVYAISRQLWSRRTS